MLRPRALGLALLSLLAVACNYKHPDPADKQATTDGPEMFELCVQCHGAQGQGRREFNAPSIAGLPRWYIEAQLKKFRSGARGTHFSDHTGMQMRPMALSFHNEGDLATIAEYVASLPRQS
ncbi:MAG TPA: c-type cytochrome, partial [Polyangiales bacterium]|nr:c-type cytochrome [Polyangiales bacterium]